MMWKFIIEEGVVQAIKVLYKSSTSGSTTDTRIRFATAAVAMARLDRVWHSHNIRFLYSVIVEMFYFKTFPQVRCGLWTIQ